MILISGREKGKIVSGVLLMNLLLYGAIIIPGVFWHKYLYSFRSIFIATRILIWLCLFVMVYYASVIEKNKLLLWQETRRPFSFYFAAPAALIGILIFSLAIINLILLKVLHVPNNDAKLHQLANLFRVNQWLLYITIITAGVVEELLFRGYLMPRLALIFRHGFWPVFISSALFALMHFSYGSVIQVVGPFYIGLVFAMFYQRYKNLKTLIICHTLWDLISVGILVWHK